MNFLNILRLHLEGGWTKDYFPVVLGQHIIRHKTGVWYYQNYKGIVYRDNEGRTVYKPGVIPWLLLRPFVAWTSHHAK